MKQTIISTGKREPHVVQQIISTGKHEPHVAQQIISTGNIKRICGNT